METRTEFQSRVRRVLGEFGQDVLDYDKNEFWMIQTLYEQLEFYAVRKRLYNMSIALPLSRGLHDGTHRKSSVTKDGVKYRLPYEIHPLMVCRMLVDLQVPLSHDEEDVLLAAALCHDMIEDIPFEHQGHELTEIYHLDPQVYETVKAVSKRKDFTAEEEQAFFRNINEHPLAALIKLSDRGNNVEDLYNMSVWKVHEYVGETNRFFLPMCQYVKEHNPGLLTSIEILEDKIVTLTQASEILVDRYDMREQELIRQVRQLQEEHDSLRKEWEALWN